MGPLKKIVILGGGTAGWMAAAMLACQLPVSQCRIVLVESEQIGIVGVGESTLPPFVHLLQKLGIDEREFVAATQGCYKLGIRFEDWLAHGHHYFHPFGGLGQRIDSHDFYHCWLKASQSGPVPPLMAFSPCAVMAEAGRFYLPGTSPGGTSGASYALHMDAVRAAAYLRDYAQARGVERIEGRVIDARQRADGAIVSLQLENGDQIDGDFFMDCSGFHGFLIERTLGVGLEDWSEYLPCDRAVSVRAAADERLPPYTQAKARKAGWSWRIPLRNGIGHGYVYSTRFCSDAEAKSTLLKSLDTARISEPRVIPFVTGRRRAMWRHNCLALGLAAGFVEPLESTSIHLIARGVEFFLRYFPDTDCNPALVREYNRRMAADYEEIRDFILLHYCTSQRTDTPFWRHCQALPLPDSLRERIELFAARGIIPDSVDPLFRHTSWQAVFEGMGVRPARYAPRTDTLDTPDLQAALQRTRSAIAALVKTQPRHEELL